jgi:hypothetical protein
VRGRRVLRSSREDSPAENMAVSFHPLKAQGGMGVGEPINYPEKGATLAGPGYLTQVNSTQRPGTCPPPPTHTPRKSSACALRGRVCNGSILRPGLRVLQDLKL